MLFDQRYLYCKWSALHRPKAVFLQLRAPGIWTWLWNMSCGVWKGWPALQRQVTLQRKRERKRRDRVYMHWTWTPRPPSLAFAFGRMVFGLLGFGNTSHWFSRCRPVWASFFFWLPLCCMPIQQARTKPQQLDRPLGLGTFYTSMEPPDLVVCFTIVYCMIAVTSCI